MREGLIQHSTFTIQHSPEGHVGSSFQSMVAARPRLRTRRESLRRHMQQNRLAYILILPSVVLIALIYLYPLGSGFWQSLHNFNRVKPWAYKFIGLQNYATAF